MTKPDIWPPYSRAEEDFYYHGTKPREEPVDREENDMSKPATAAHTKGPWHLSASERFVRKATPTAGDGPKDFNICNVNENVPEFRANARLIVWAPEMFEALERIAYEPQGSSDATHRQVLDAVTEIARDLLERIKEHQNKDI